MPPSAPPVIPIVPPPPASEGLFKKKYIIGVIMIIIGVVLYVYTQTSIFKQDTPSPSQCIDSKTIDDSAKLVNETFTNDGDSFKGTGFTCDETLYTISHKNTSFTCAKGNWSPIPSSGNKYGCVKKTDMCDKVPPCGTGYKQKFTDPSTRPGKTKSDCCDQTCEGYTCANGTLKNSPGNIVRTSNPNDKCCDAAATKTCDLATESWSNTGSISPTSINPGDYIQTVTCKSGFTATPSPFNICQNTGMFAGADPCVATENKCILTSPTQWNNHGITLQRYTGATPSFAEATACKSRVSCPTGWGGNPAPSPTPTFICSSSTGWQINYNDTNSTKSESFEGYANYVPQPIKEVLDWIAGRPDINEKSKLSLLPGFEF